MIVQIYEISSVQAALSMAALGVDHLGMVVGKKSPERPGWISAGEAAEISAALRGLEARSSLIVISTDVAEVADVAARVRPDILHLSMRPEDFPVAKVQALRARLPVGIRLMQAIPVGGPESRAEALGFVRQFSPSVDILIIDTRAAGVVGATGRVNDWSIGREIVEMAERPVILAGGLGPDNVAEAIRAVHPWGVDSMSHTNLPGTAEKDPARVRRFVAEANGV